MDAEKAQKKLEELRSKRSRKDYWSPKPGTKPNRIRVLPNWNGDPQGDFYRETARHNKLGTERDKSAVCLLREGFEKCPVCEMVRELYKTKEKDDADLAKTVKAQTRVYYNIIDLDNTEKGVQVWGSGVDALEQILAFCANPMYGDISDPENGRNISIVMTEGKNTKSGYNEYTVQPDPERTPLGNPEWILSMVDLDALVKPISYEELEALLMGRPAPAAVPVSGGAEVKPAEEKLQPGKVEKADEPCIGKYSSDDPQCESCWEKEKCVGIKKARMSVKPATVLTPKAEPVKQEVAKDTTAKPSSSIQDMLSKVRQDREKGKK